MSALPLPGSPEPAAAPAARAATPAPTLAEVLRNPAIWRGRDCAPEPAAVPTGFPELDRVLPGGGWPRGALAECLLAHEGVGEIRLLLPALVALQAAGREVIWIAPPHLPYAPALAAAGLDLARLVVVRCRDPRDALWAWEQALRAPEAGAAFAWLPVRDERVLRRLQVAAREGGTFGMLWRRPGERSEAAAVPLRLGLASREGRLAVHVLKRRGGTVAAPVVLDVDARWVPPFAGPGYRTLAAEPLALPRPGNAKPDPRTTLGAAARAASPRRAGVRH